MPTTPKIKHRPSSAAFVVLAIMTALVWLSVAREAFAGVCMNDAQGNCVDRSAPYPTIGATNFATTQASVGTTAVQIVSARTGGIGVGRVSLIITNSGTVAIVCGPTSGVTTSTGAVIPAGTTTPPLQTTSAVYCISGLAAQAASAWETY